MSVAAERCGDFGRRDGRQARRLWGEGRLGYGEAGMAGRGGLGGRRR